MDFTDLLDVLGVVSLLVFAALLWLPLALLVFAAACFLLSWHRSRGGGS